jgi:hypothetical protein
VKDECVRLLNETVQALQMWREPIDVIIAFYALVDMPDHPLPLDMKTDEFLNEMQDYYSSLGQISREALFLYENYPSFSQNAISEVSSRMKSGKPLDKIGDNKTVNFGYFLVCGKSTLIAKGLIRLYLCPHLYPEFSAFALSW